MPKSQAYIGHLMILATTFIYSFNTNFMKVIIPEWIGPNGLVLLRCSASTLVFWLIGLYFPTSSDHPHPPKKEIGMMILGGILGLGGNLLFYINGLSLTYRCFCHPHHPTDHRHCPGGYFSAYRIYQIQSLRYSTRYCRRPLCLHYAPHRKPGERLVRRRCPGFLLFGFLLLLSDPDQTLYPKIRFGHRHEMDELIFDDHQLTFRAVRSGQITFIFRPGSPSHLARNLLYTFRCHRDRLFFKCLRPKLHHPLRRKCL